MKQNWTDEELTNSWQIWSGRPGWFPTSAPHRSGRARLTHPALRLTGSQQDGNRGSWTVLEVDSVPEVGRTPTTTSIRSGTGA